MDVVISLPKKVDVMKGRSGSRTSTDEEKFPSTEGYKTHYVKTLMLDMDIGFPYRLKKDLITKFVSTDIGVKLELD
tara:strand:- start:60 stop:287 length:228 start_codon:yes stop_codon:yes gene_type:complete